MTPKLALFAAFTVAAFTLLPADASAQGCINSRSSIPLMDANGPYVQRGEFIFAQNFRYLKADKHFVGTTELTGLNATGSNAINEQRNMDLSLIYGLTDRVSLNLVIPYLMSGDWSLPLPMGPPMMPTGTKGPRYHQNSEGIGDMQLLARTWVLDPAENLDKNLAFGVGVKAPTGDHNVTDYFGQMDGTNFGQYSVDSSIQPGDGGWGAVLDTQSFMTTSWATLFVAGSYTINPQESNDATSTPANLMGISNVPADIRYNSIPDRYLFRAGMAREFTAIPGLVPQLSWRIEGTAQRDLFGGNDGYRQSGYTTSIEPGLTYSFGISTFSVSLPIALVRNRQDGPQNIAGDATFADWMLLFGWSFSL
jgi:hypothetical protein